tara:strand:- start:78 stop:962 length:885 start_codon:yes stop_codon:yes gene_type:complete
LKILLKISLKLFLIVICLYLIRDKLNLELLNLTGFDKTKFLLTFMIFFTSQIILGIRLKYALNYFNEFISLKKVLLFNFISKIYSLFGLLGIAVDTSRFLLLSNEINSKKNIIKILFLDRILGVSSILVLTALSGFIYFCIYFKIIILSLCMFILFLIILYFLIKNKIYNFIISNILSKIQLKFNKYFFLSLFCSFLSWILIIISLFYFFGEFINFNFISLFAITICILITIIPISPLGIGSANLGAVLVFGYFELNTNIGFLMISYMQLFMIIYILIFCIPLNIYNIFYKRLK